MPAKADDALSTFEQRRRANLQTNAALLKDLSAAAQKVLPQPKAKPAPSKKRKAAADGSVRSPRAKREPRRVLPVRQSSRLAGLEADNEVLKRKLEVEAEAEAERHRMKRMRVSGDLDLKEVVVDGKKWDGALEGLETLKSMSFRGAQPGVRTFTEEDVKETKNADLKQLRVRMGGLKLYETFPVQDIKLVPQRIYSLGFHPTEDKPIIFAGDKEGNMGVFDASQEAQVLEEDEDGEEVHAPPVISAFKTHSRTISSFLFSTTEANSVFTSSYDSSIRKLDLAKGTSVEIYAPDDPSVDTPVSALDMSASDPHTLLFSTLQGDVGRYDMRTEPSTADVWSLSDQKIGGFSMHPLQAHLIATASLDRTLKIWDLRKMQGSGANRHPALLGEHESRLSVSHASWSRGGRIATSSYDDTVKIHDFSSSCSSPPSNAATWPVGHDISDAAMQPAHTIKHNNQTGRWVTILKPQWQLRPRDGIDKLAIGNMNRFVDVFAADGEQLAQLEGEGITAVPAVAHFHPSMDWVAGGSASGKLALWM